MTCNISDTHSDQGGQNHRIESRRYDSHPMIRISDCETSEHQESDEEDGEPEGCINLWCTVAIRVDVVEYNTIISSSNGTIRATEL